MAICKGYSYDTPDGREYDCEYEFAGEVSCEDCIFGPFKGPLDPNLEEE